MTLQSRMEDEDREIILKAERDQTPGIRAARLAQHTSANDERPALPGKQFIRPTGWSPINCGANTASSRPSGASACGECWARWARSWGCFPHYENLVKGLDVVGPDQV